MNSALEQFESNIQRTRTLVAIHNVLGTRTTSALDTSDILRSDVNSGHEIFHAASSP